MAADREELAAQQQLVDDVRRFRLARQQARVEAAKAELLRCYTAFQLLRARAGTVGKAYDKIRVHLGYSHFNFAGLPAGMTAEKLQKAIVTGLYRAKAPSGLPINARDWKWQDLVQELAGTACTGFKNAVMAC